MEISCDGPMFTNRGCRRLSSSSPCRHRIVIVFRRYRHHHRHHRHRRRHRCLPMGAAVTSSPIPSRFPHPFHSHFNPLYRCARHIDSFHSISFLLVYKERPRLPGICAFRTHARAHARTHVCANARAHARSRKRERASEDRKRDGARTL